MRLINAIMASLAGKRKKQINTQRREQEVTPVRKDNTPPSLCHTQITSCRMNKTAFWQNLKQLLETEYPENRQVKVHRIST